MHLHKNDLSTICSKENKFKWAPQTSLPRQKQELKGCRWECNNNMIGQPMGHVGPSRGLMFPHLGHRNGEIHCQELLWIKKLSLSPQPSANKKRQWTNEKSRCNRARSSGVWSPWKSIPVAASADWLDVHEPPWGFPITPWSSSQPTNCWEIMLVE